MKHTTLLLLVLAANMSFARSKDHNFPLTIKVLAADQVKTTKPLAPPPTYVENSRCPSEMTRSDLERAPSVN